MNFFMFITAANIYIYISMHLISLQKVENMYIYVVQSFQFVYPNNSIGSQKNGIF